MVTVCFWYVPVVSAARNNWSLDAGAIGTERWSARQAPAEAPAASIIVLKRIMRVGYRVRRLCTTLLLETVFQVGVAIGPLGELIARHFVLGLGTGAAFAQDTIEPMLWLGFHLSLRQPEDAITGYRVPPPSAAGAKTAAPCRWASSAVHR
jgi:hypothetical protein